MAMKTSGQKGGMFNEINITPLTDIFLVLLIIMMLIAPLFQSIDREIVLPSINSGVKVDEKEVTVSVTKNSKFYVNTKNVKETELTEELKAMLEGREESAEKKLVVKADASTKTSEIMKVIRAAQEAGYEKLTVAGEPLTQNQQKDLEKKVEE